MELIISQEPLQGKLIGGGYNAEYQHINNKNILDLLSQCPNDSKIIIKPTVGGESGRGVTMYEKSSKSESFHLKGYPQTILDEEQLNSHGSNFIIQEAIDQHPYISQFNPSSINTLRIATYRSVKDESIHILSSVIRIGNNGSVVDNLHAGGKMVKIDSEGFLANYCTDQYAQRQDSHNGIDFSKNTYQIPNWDKVISFAKEVSSKILNARLVQLDVTMDGSGEPKLIEFNVTGFSMWIAQFTGTPALGDYTEEIRQYAIKHTLV